MEWCFHRTGPSKKLQGFLVFTHGCPAHAIGRWKSLRNPLQHTVPLFLNSTAAPATGMLRHSAAIVPPKPRHSIPPARAGVFCIQFHSPAGSNGFPPGRRSPRSDTTNLDRRTGRRSECRRSCRRPQHRTTAIERPWCTCRRRLPLQGIWPKALPVRQRFPRRRVGSTELAHRSCASGLRQAIPVPPCRPCLPMPRRP